MVCHSLLQWTTICQTSPPWPDRLGWPHRAWLSFTELDKTVVHVIRLASCLWLYFESVCPLMPSLSTYRLTWVSLTSDMGNLFTAAPAKHSRCSLTFLSRALWRQKGDRDTLIWVAGSEDKKFACSAGDLGQEGPLERRMAPYSSILAWRIPWTEEPGEWLGGGPTVHGVAKSRMWLRS